MQDSSRSVRRTWCGVALVVGALALGGAPAHADQLIDETFTNSTVSDPTFVTGGTGFQGCLTASQSQTETPVPGCAAGSPSLPPGGDPSGSGTLRLTSNGNNLSGYLLYNKALPLTAGVEADFDFFAYNGSTGTGADGISFFLADGGTDLTSTGATGGSLGYAQKTINPIHDGLAGGYLGLGFDEYGNYSNPTEGRDTGCASNPAGGFKPQSVALRGPGSGSNGYCLLGTMSVAGFGGISSSSATNRNTAGVIRTARLVVDPLGQPGAQVTAYVDFHDGAGLRQVFQAPLPPNPPSTFKFGFASSTGSSTNIHEIRFVKIETLQDLPQLTLTKTHSGSPIAGQTTPFQLQATVSGAPGAGYEQAPVTITDPLPAGDTVASAPSGDGWDCSATVVGSGTAVCTYPASVDSPLAPGTVLPPITVPVRIGSSHVGTYTNTATASSTDNANTPEQSSATDQYAVGQLTDLSIVKTAAPNPATVGRPLTFTLDVHNAGPSDATGVVVSDPLPNGVTFASASPGCSLSGTTVTCAVGGLAAGASTQIQIAVTPTAQLAEGRIRNTATVTGNEPDPDPGNNTSTVPIDVLPLADLGVTKSTKPAQTYGGSQVISTLVVTNHGPSGATGVTLTDTLPAGLTYASASPSQGHCQASGQTVTCDLGSLPNGASAQVLVAAKVGSGLIGQTLTNTAHVTGVEPDGNLANNDDQASVKVVVTPPKPPVPPATPPTGPFPPTIPRADLAITKTPESPFGQIGRDLSYTVVVRNDGPATATGVVMTDTTAVPVKLISVRTSAGTCKTALPVTCALGSIASGHAVTITVVIQPLQTGLLPNSASATGDELDPKVSNNLVTVRVPVAADRGGVRISKRASRRTAHSGDRIDYRIAVRSTGPSAARSVVVCDRLPRDLILVRAPGARTSRGQVCWKIASLAVGKTRTFTVAVKVARLSGSSRQARNVARADGPNIATGRAQARVRLLPPRRIPPRFTG